MNTDRRRQHRIQGGWASSGKPVATQKAHIITTNTRSTTMEQQRSTSAGEEAFVRPSPTGTPGWLAHTVDRPSTGKKFVYEPQSHEKQNVKVKPKDRVISKAGVYDIGTQPSGLSRVRLFPCFLEKQEADWLYDQLYHELPWTQKKDVNKSTGVSYLQPRLTAWYGDLPYRYSGVTQEANANWHPALVMLRQRLEENTGYCFNSVLANLYRDGHDSVDWHSDDEPALGTKPTIASLSFGDVRNFEMRKKQSQMEDPSCSDIKIPLTHGSLLIMEGSVQEDWQHCIHKEYHDRDPRINLTFRTMIPQKV